jgi:DNA uptake protein ComE-like DNA-binding protein
MNTRVLRTLIISVAVLAGSLSLVEMAVAQVGKNVSGYLEANKATRDELLALPGMNAELADAIINGRPYKDMLTLNAVVSPKLSAEQRAELYKKLWLPINLNTATREEIQLVPGMTPRMIREFEEYKPYPALAKFHREIDKYVDDAELARLEQYVMVPIDLNTAGDEDILSIPGMGPRMLREFKEYRPYANIEQFRREIGKYVDKVEVARLERYVTIK